MYLCTWAKGRNCESLFKCLCLKDKCRFNHTLCIHACKSRNRAIQGKYTDPTIIRLPPVSLAVVQVHGGGQQIQEPRHPYLGGVCGVPFYCPLCTGKVITLPEGQLI